MTIAPASTCVHHWRISEPDGRPAVPGTCHRCGATRMFRASYEDDQDWGGGAPSSDDSNMTIKPDRKAKKRRRTNP